MVDIAKNSELNPVNFDNSFNDLTKGQTLLLQLLVNKLETKTPITKEDIETCYIQSVSNNGIKKIFTLESNGIGGYHYRNIDTDLKTHWATKSKSLQWFKMNLGSCILKGKLLVIPVIEI